MIMSGNKINVISTISLDDTRGFHNKKCHPQKLFTNIINCIIFQFLFNPSIFLLYSLTSIYIRWCLEMHNFEGSFACLVPLVRDVIEKLHIGLLGVQKKVDCNFVGMNWRLMLLKFELFFNKQ